MGDDMDSLQRLFDETVKSHREEQEQLYLTIQVLQNRIHELENAPTEEVDNDKSFARFVELKDQNRSLKNEVKLRLEPLIATQRYHDQLEHSFTPG